MALKEGIGAPFNPKDISTPDLWRWRFGQVFKGIATTKIPSHFGFKGGLQATDDDVVRLNFLGLIEHSRMLDAWEIIINSLKLNRVAGNVENIFAPLIDDVAAERLRPAVFEDDTFRRKGLFVISASGIGEEKMTKVVVPRLLGLGFTQAFETQPSTTEVTGYVFMRQAKIRR